MSPCQVPVSKVSVPPASGVSAGGGLAPGVDAAQAGFWAPALGPYANQGPGGLAGSRCYFVRAVCPVSQTISKVGFSVVAAATADDPCDVGVYDAAGNKLGSSGSTTGRLNSTGAKTVNLLTPVAVVAGQVYYAAFGSGPLGGTAAQLTMATINFNLGYMFGSGAGQQEQPGVNGTFPLPASMGATPSSLGSCPILALMQ
jgi:hypothetical protein